ncbi:MAG: AAA family ATPase [Bacillota bacterium]
MTGDKDSIRRDRSMLVQALLAAGAKIKGSDVLCPYHQDKHPSGSIHRDKTDNAYRYTCHVCHVGGDYFDLEARRTGKSVEDLLKEVTAASKPVQPAWRSGLTFKSLDDLRGFYERKGLKVENTFQYGRPEDVKLVVLRCREADGRKTFKQAHAAPGGFQIGHPGGLIPLYGLARIEQAHSILVVEGEKCCHAVARHLPEGWAVTTSAGGAEKANLSDWSSLSGKARVVLFPDADAPDPAKGGKVTGKAHMEQVKGLILGIKDPPPLYWIDSWNLNLPPKGDVVEFLDTFEGDEAKAKGIHALLTGAEPLGISRNVLEFLKKVMAGELRSEPWPWDELTRMTQALLPGTVTALCGDPGCGKSFLVIESVSFWYQQGIPCAVFELEDDKEYHIRRAWAQIEGNGELTQLDWIERPENHHTVLRAHERWADFMDGVEKCIFAEPEKQQTYADLLKWARERAEAGSRIIVIDPITMAKHMTREIWEEDTAFLNDIKAVARDYQVSVVLVTHPKKGAKNGSLDDLSGGAAFPRFAHTVLWLIKHDEDKDVTTASRAKGRRLVTINRTMQIRKARNGRGGGRNVAFNFEGQTLRFIEEGSIEKESADGGPVDSDIPI